MKLKNKVASKLVAIVFVALFVAVGMDTTTRAANVEYGDVVINNYSDAAGMRPVIFPHWFHRARFQCKVCHADLDFEFKAGGNDINMLKIFNGKYCGECHNGEIAWGPENCELCHSGKFGTSTSVHNSTLERLISP